MIRFPIHILFSIASNSLALFGAAYFVNGFDLSGTLTDLLIAGVVLTAINFIIRPILRFFLAPVIILTLGLGIIALNAGLLSLLDFFLDTVTISGLIPLLYATVIISIVNIAIHGTTHLTFRN